MSDAASLSNLHDVALPAPVDLWPLAPGWYVVAVVTSALSLYLIWRGWQSWRRNRYRGQALRELERIRQRAEGRGLDDVPVLLKRAALSAWPREQVAALTGPDWYRFLDGSAGTDRFRSGAGVLLERLAYPSSAGGALSAAEEITLLDAVGDWLKRHQGPAEER
jgi:hypothetical protein